MFMKRYFICDIFNRYLMFFFFLFIKESISLAGVPVNINSGNPKFPFPQFLAYEAAGGHKLGNLATKNAFGVPHAEMEQTIRDAWQIFANQFVYSGETYAGVKYIKGNTGCPYDCSEGDGYALLGAAYMGDKTTFDGLWFRTHDLRRATKKKYSDCSVTIRAGYLYGDNSLAEPGGDAATDGDVDIALSLLMAWQQWGDNSGYKDACGNDISYKTEALEVIRGLVEIKDHFNVPTDCRRTSGEVGFDGYVKNGNTWGEVTNWATGASPQCPEFGGSQFMYVDYNAPSYANAFASFLQAKGGTPEDLSWNISQLKRMAASADWIVNKHYSSSSAAILNAGQVTINGSNTTIFSSFNSGEDFRFSWRTALNYVWHGNPSTTWDPTTHQIKPGGNKYEFDMAKRHASFMANPAQAPWSNACLSPGGGPTLTYNGPSQLVAQYSPVGVSASTFPLNWNAGTGAPAAVAAQDYELMGKLYRQCAIEWDTQSAGDGYLTSVPIYFHGWFRLLGMLVTSGNNHSPMQLVDEANLKVYHSVDKTYAFTGDVLNYTINYRNYASMTATGVTVSTTLPAGLVFVSASNGGTISGGTISWNIGSVPGFTSQGGVPPTQGSVTFKVKVATGFSGQICNTVNITAANGKGWTSNEFPNNITAVMERNCVDIVMKAMTINKTSNYAKVNVGNNVTYTLDFENASKGGFINGGRPGVNIAYAHDGTIAVSNQHLIKVRLYHGAVEPYIDYGNYRISMFINDNSLSCVIGEPGCTLGWQLDNTIKEGVDPTKVKISSEAITPGSDARGAWNQRVIVQFSNQLATTTPHISRYYGLVGGRVHLGGAQPLRAVWQMHPSNWSNVNWADDWSWNPAVKDGDGGLYFPVTNDFTDINNPNIPVSIWHNEACEKPTAFVDNILVEEWDGYTWRRIFGNGPLPGRDVSNVVLTDTLPLGFTFKGFIDPNGVNVGNTISVLGQTATYTAATRIISWSIPKLQVKQKGTIKYMATAGFSSGVCPRVDEYKINTASLVGTNESPVTSSDTVTVTCTPVILPPPPSSMTKTADKITYVVGDNISYTLSYKNTDGTIANGDLNAATNWTQQSGLAMTVGGGTLKNVSNDAGVMTYNYSHGLNGTIQASINFASSAAFGIAFRHSGGAKANGEYIIFKPNPGAGSIEVRAYNGIVQVGTTQTIGYPGTPTNIKLQLLGTQVNVWVGNLTNPVPSLTFTGFTAKGGYAGFINGWANDGGDSYGAHSVVSFSSHLDSGFNLKMTDPIPVGLTFVSASDLGLNNSGVVEFPAVAGPVLANDIVTRTWIAKLATCPAGGKIVNNAYTDMMGLTPGSIASQVISSCGATGCTIPINPGTIGADQTLCGTTSAAAFTETTASTGGIGSYTYQWQSSNDNVTFTDIPLAISATYNPGKVATTKYFRRVVSSFTCTAQNTASVFVKVYPVISPGSAGSNQSLCYNQIPSVLKEITPASGGTGVYNYQWQTSSDSITYKDMPGETLTTYAPPALTATTWYRRNVTAANCGVFNSPAVKITVYPALLAGSIGTSQTLCGKTQASPFTELTPATGGDANYTYTWQSSSDNITFNTIANATANVYSPGTVTTTTYFRRGVASATCVSANSAFVAVKVYPAISSGTVGSSQTICYNQVPAGFKEVIPPSGGTGSYTYQWQSSKDSITFNNLNAADTTKNYAPGALTSSVFYRRQVFSGTCPAASSTNAITITSVTPGTIAGRQFICYNSIPNSLTSSSAPSGGTPPYKYQWQSSSDSITYTDIPGETFTTYSPPALTATTWYRRNVTGTTCGTLNSLAVKITVFQPLTPGSIGADQQICSNTAPDTLRNVLLPTGGSNAYKYIWQYSLNNVSWSTISSASNTYYKPPVLNAVTYYRRQVVSGTCDTLVSQAVKIDVMQNTTAKVSVQDPGPICANEIVSLLANVTNGGKYPTYQWYKNGLALTGETKNTYTSSTLKDKDSLRVVVSSNAICETNPAVSSNKIIVSVSTLVLPAVSINANPGNTVCSGTPVQFAIGARSGQGNTPGYTWIVNNIATGITDTIYKPASLADGDSIQVEVNSSSSCASTKVVRSKAIHMKINSNVTPKVGIASDKSTICKGDKVSFRVNSVQNGGATPGYQWLLNGASLIGKNDTVFSSTTLNNGDQIQLIMSSGLACVTKQRDTSQAISITVNNSNTLNVILNDPGMVCSNTLMTFRATTKNGGPNPVFTWRVDGLAPNPSPAPGDSVYNATLKNNQTIQVSVKSSLNCISSPNATSNMVIMKVSSGTKAAAIGYTGNPYCAGNGSAIPVAGNPGTTGIFSSKTGLAINTNSGVVDLSLSTPGTYTVQNKVSGACGTDSTSTSITISSAPMATFSYSGTPYCNTILTADPTFSNGGKAGTFSSVKGLVINTTSGVVDLVASIPGTYAVTNTINTSGSCPAASSTTSIVINSGNPNPKFSYAGNPNCHGSGNIIPVMAQGATKGVFTAVPSGLPIDSTTGIVKDGISTPGTYVVSNTIAPVGACPGAKYATDLVITAPTPLSFWYPNHSYCKGGPNPTPQFVGQSKAGKFICKNPKLVMDSATGIINIAATPAGTYFISNTLPPSRGCPAGLAGAEVVILDTPLLTLSPDVRIGQGQSTTLTASGASTYLWSPATGLSCTTCTTVSANPDKTTVYFIEGDEKGCKTTGKIKVTVDPCGEVYVPNAFNPASTDQNSMVCVYGNCVTTINFMIFDRWGEKVYETTDQTQCWDGNYHGQPMNSGEFVYVLKAVLFGGEEISRKGNISLIR
jgi:gliding motility-associated-like protein/uncharacterized repeat protein (TIGR01451 family)